MKASGKTGSGKNPGPVIFCDVRLKIVDGWKIRNTLDIEFGAVGDRSLYPYVAAGELWVDRAFLPEKEFLVRQFRLKKNLTRRFGYEGAKARMRPKGAGRPAALSCRTAKLAKTGDVNVWLVAGSEVRRRLDPNFCFGGHWLVYGYIPRGDVWLDDAADPKEMKYVLLHELVELQLMKGGKRYSDAHDFANAAEREARRRDGVAHYAKD